MKKLIIATIACAFICSPAFATDFAAEQTKVLDRIIAAMDEMKANPEKMDLLTSERNCVEAASNIEDLQKCVSNATAQHLEKTAKN